MGLISRLFPKLDSQIFHNQICCLIRQNRMPSRFLTYPSTNHKVALIPVCEFDSLMSLIH